MNRINNLINTYYPNATQEEKQNIRQYMIDNIPSDEERQEYLYMNKPEYLWANDVINALSYREFHKPEWTGEYQGFRCTCMGCKYHKYDTEFKDNATIYHSDCKMIDHN
jgi:hypothetical protein